MNTLVAVACFSAVLISPAPAQNQQQKPPTPGQSVQRGFDDVNRRLLEMAQDFPEDKYFWAPKPEVRTFGSVIVHVVAGNEFGARYGKGENVKWDDLEQDPKKYTSKAQVVQALKASIAAADATLKATPEDKFKETISPWLSIIEHAGEHYGQLVVYYRINGLVPPESRPKK
jgi:uncharacterized damage-inducible protein DinB